MFDIDKAIGRLKEYEHDLSSFEVIRDALNEKHDEIVSMNADIQLFERGKTATGVSIDTYAPYSPVTISIKKSKGQPTDRVTLRDTGAFEASFFIAFGTDSFEIKATDAKTESLVRRYGKDILGLSNEHLLEVIWDYIYPYLNKQLEKAIWED